MPDTPEPPAPPTPGLMAEYEARAEAAYARLYDVTTPSHALKDLKDDASQYLTRAIQVADALNLPAEATRLRARRDNILAVWNSQFRGSTNR